MKAHDGRKSKASRKVLIVSSIAPGAHILINAASRVSATVSSVFRSYSVVKEFYAASSGFGSG
jgi:hypothetical protein